MREEGAKREEGVRGGPKKGLGGKWRGWDGVWMGRERET